MAKNNKKTVKNNDNERDSTYFLKLVIYILAGTLWLKFQSPIYIMGFAFNGLPLGLLVGMLFASHDHFQMDRKIEYAVLLIVTIVTYFLPAGIVI